MPEQKQDLARQTDDFNRYRRYALYITKKKEKKKSAKRKKDVKKNPGSQTVLKLFSQKMQYSCKKYDFETPVKRISENPGEIIPRSFQIIKKLWNMKNSVIPIIIGALGNGLQRLIKGTKRIENWAMNRYHPNNSVKISANVSVKKLANNDNSLEKNKSIS